jgi:hypothetical protein
MERVKTISIKGSDEEFEATRKVHIPLQSLMLAFKSRAHLDACN